MPDRTLCEGKSAGPPVDRSIEIDQVGEFAPQGGMTHDVLPLPFVLSGKPLPPRQRLNDRPWNRILQATYDLARLENGRPILDRERETRRCHHLLDCRLLVTFAHAVIAGDARLHVAELVERIHQLVVDVVEHITTNGRDALSGFDNDIHRAFSVAAGGLANETRHQFSRPRYFQIEKAPRTL